MTTPSATPNTTAMAKPASVDISVCPAFSNSGSHHFTMLCAIADGAGSTNSATLKTWQAISQTTSVPAMISHGSSLRSRCRRRSAMIISSMRRCAAVRSRFASGCMRRSPRPRGLR